MALGVIERRTDISGKPVKVAFAGRKKPGSSLLKLLQRRFGAQRSAADLWNMFGGEAHEIDFFLRERLEATTDADVPRHARALRVPSLVDDEFSTIYVRTSEIGAIADCLDCLPWSPLAWSIHRGMKDILVAYALPYMKVYRTSLASTLHAAVKTYELRLIQLGWEADFVRGDMADQAASAFCGDDRCSGDVCRIVSAAAEVFCSKTVDELDRTTFWVRNLQTPPEEMETRTLSSDMVAALVKVHFVWWSHEFDYDIYTRLPLNIMVC